MREKDGLYEIVDEKSSLKYIEIGTDYMALVIKFKDTKSKKIEKAFFWKMENISYKFIDDHILHLTDYRPNEKRMCTTVTYRVKDPG